MCIVEQIAASLIGCAVAVGTRVCDGTFIVVATTTTTPSNSGSTNTDQDQDNHDDDTGCSVGVVLVDMLTAIQIISERDEASLDSEPQRARSTSEQHSTNADSSLVVCGNLVPARDRLRRLIVMPIRYKRALMQQMQRQQQQQGGSTGELLLMHRSLYACPKGLLLKAHASDGVLLLVKQVAREAQATVVQIKAADMLGMYVGDTEAALRRVFAEAAAAARANVESRTCLLMIDQLVCRGHISSGAPPNPFIRSCDCVST